MAKVFTYGLIGFIICAFVTNNQQTMFTSILETPVTVFEIVKVIVLSACLWSGFLNIIKASGFITHIAFICRPILRFMYGNIVDDTDVFMYLSSNFIANLLGVGSLASISGLKAMKVLMNKQKSSIPTKEMMVLVIINTTGLSFVPSTLMSIRQSYQSQDIVGFFKYSVIIGMVITILGILISKVIEHHD
jgi:spore maturation protein A